MKGNDIKKTIVFFSRDPAGVQAILPVLQRCQRDPELASVVVSCPVSRFLFERYHIPSLHIPNDVSDEFQRTFDAILDAQCPQLVISGTSVRQPGDLVTPEQWVVARCKASRVKTVTILDFWGRYFDRFSEDGQTMSARFIPDHLCVLDERCFHDLKRLGVDERVMRVTHNPYFDEVVRQGMGETSTPTAEICQGRWNILYVSQPLLEFQGAGHCGRTQHALFEVLCQELSAWCPEQRKHVIVWMHPKENMDKWKRYDGEYCGLSIQVSKRSLNGNHVFPHLTFLATSHSSVVYEALYFDTPCLSMQFGTLNGGEQLVTNQMSLSLLITSRAELRTVLRAYDFAALRKGLSEKRRNLADRRVFFSDGNATNRIYSLVQSLLN